MSFFLAQRIELDPTNVQRGYFARACGCARFAYNWGLAQWCAQYTAYVAACKQNPGQTLLKPPTQYSIRRDLNAIKETAFPWMLEVTKCAVQYALIDLGQAFSNFFRNPTHFRYPKKRRKYVDDSFSFSSDDFEVDGSRIRIPKLGWVRMRESLRFKNCKLLRATVSRKAGRWFVSIACEVPDLSHLRAAENQGVCGVDLGVKSLAVLSNGVVFEGPKSYETNLKKLKRLQRTVSRRQKGSRNRVKAIIRLQRLHARIANIRRDALHKLTSYLTSHFQTIVIEDLNVSGMLKNHCLARRIADMGFYEFRRQLEYKAKMRGCEVVVADRFYPSSKRCNACGSIHQGLTLADRHWQCPHCAAMLDRDLNAAMNLRDLAASSAVSACGESSSGP